MSILSASRGSASSLPADHSPAVQFTPSLAWVKPLTGTLLTLGLGLGIAIGLTDLPWSTRLVLITFGVAVVGWIFTEINDTYIAVVAALVLTLSEQGDPTSFFATLGDPMIWLLLASFIIAAGVTASGLSARLTAAVASRTHSVNQLCYGLTLVILSTAFVIPATSGRAALLLPIFLSLSKAINQPRISRALALLFPTTILLSAVASLLGAGAHLVTADLVARLTGETITFARWALLGLPFALVSCLLSTWVILHLFLTQGERTQPLQLGADAIAANQHSPLNRREWYMTLTLVLLVLLWATESLHGVNNTVIALLGALAVTLPHVELVPFKNALKSVEWNLLLFMAATLKISEALVTSGAADWLIHHTFQALATDRATSSLLLITVVAAVSLLAHLLITSRTARASVLVPLVVLLALSLEFNPLLLAFLSTAAAGFCLTLPVSAKPVAMFANLEVPAYTPRDLLRLSGVLLPLHLVLLIVFALWIWPALGLTPQHSVATTQPAREEPPMYQATKATPALATGQPASVPVGQAAGTDTAMVRPALTEEQQPALVAGDGTLDQYAVAPLSHTTHQSISVPTPATAASAITTTVNITPTQPAVAAVPSSVPLPTAVPPITTTATAPLPLAPPAPPVIVPSQPVVELPPAPGVEPAVSPPAQPPVVEVPPAPPVSQPAAEPHGATHDRGDDDDDNSDDGSGGDDDGGDDDGGDDDGGDDD